MGEFVYRLWLAFDGYGGQCPPSFALYLVDEQCLDILTGAGRQLVDCEQALRAALQEVTQHCAVHGPTPTNARQLYVFTWHYTLPCDFGSPHGGLPVDGVDGAAAESELSSLSSCDTSGYGSLSDDEEEGSNYS